MLSALDSLLFINRNICHVCKENKIIKDMHICLDCESFIKKIHKKSNKEVPGIDEIYVSTLYSSHMKKLIQDFKFHDKSYLYRVLGDIMVETIKRCKINEHNNIDYLVYVPMHRVKEAKRGYNQSELLSRRISERLGIPIEGRLIKKVKRTKPQSSLEIKDRGDNLGGTIKLNEKIDKTEFEDKTILLIDDILTTGKTLEENAKELKKIKNINIIGLTLSTGSLDR